MMRHKVDKHPEGEEDDNEIHEDDISDSVSNDDATDVSTQTSSEEGSDEGSNESSDEDSDESSGEGSDESSGEGSDDEAKDSQYNLWTYLKNKALEKNDKKFRKKQEAFINKGESEDDAEISAFHSVLPDIRKDISKAYTELLLVWHYAEDDKDTEKIIETKRKLIEDDDYDVDEAIYSAVKKRKYIIEKETKTRDVDIKQRNKMGLEDSDEDSEHDE